MEQYDRLCASGDMEGPKEEFHAAMSVLRATALRIELSNKDE
jgi:hypothetical protein